MYFYAFVGEGKSWVNTYFGKAALVLPKVLHHQLDKWLKNGLIIRTTKDIGKLKQVR